MSDNHTQGKGFTIMRMFILSAVLFFVAGSAQAATLDIQAGQLFGATGVDVAGTLYDVQFIDGTCAALYIGCELSNPGSFGDQTFALKSLSTPVWGILIRIHSSRMDAAPAQGGPRGIIPFVWL
jgi:hypothetical protein